MFAMSLQEDAPEEHVPAWKKLGLKLKYAPETNGASITANHLPTVNEKKRKRSSDKDALSPVDSNQSEKRKKTKVKALGSTIDASISNNAFQPPNDSATPSDQESPSRSSGPRKSVSFTPDTKKTDGDSVKQLYKTWLYSTLAKDPSFDPATVNPALQIITPRTISSPTSEASSAHPPTTKKVKKPKDPKKSTAAGGGRSSSRAKESFSSSHQATLDYLHTYHTSPSLWKFSKSRQSYLFRNLFSPGFIPPSFEPALKAYISGLQGEAAKSRLRTMAQKIRAEGSPHVAPAESNDSEKARAQDVMTEDSARARKKHKDKKNSSEVDLDANANANSKEGEKNGVVNEDSTDQKLAAARRIADIVLESIGDEPEVGNGDNDNNNGHKSTNSPPTIMTDVDPPPSRLIKKYRKRKQKARWSNDDDDDSSSSSSANSSSNKVVE